MILALSTVEQAGGLADLLERQPLAAFLALTLIALVALFFLLLREMRAHTATLREVVGLTAAISKQWDSQLKLLERVAYVLDSLSRTNRRRAPSNSDLPKVGDS